MTERRTAAKDNVLVVGATGFLGPALVEELLLAGFSVVCGVRNLGKASRELNFDGIRLMPVDLNQDLTPSVWLPRLREYRIDRVVNNVGIANCFGCQSLENVNVRAPLALFQAFEQYLSERGAYGQIQDPVRVIQISTTGVDWPDCDRFPYPASKKLLEEELARFEDLSHIIVRPNVIYEPERGHLLLEQIARIPFIFYIGESLIQPIHCREVAIGVARLLRSGRKIDPPVLRATGPEPMTWRQIFTVSSRALGRKHICYCRVPLRLAQLVTMCIQLLPDPLLRRFGILSKMDPETIVMMTRGSTGSNEAWLRATGLKPIDLETTYRAYARGPITYKTFIDDIRR